MRARVWFDASSFAGRLAEPKPEPKTAGGPQPVEQWDGKGWVIRWVEVQACER